jgi:hypothetical protein
MRPSGPDRHEEGQGRPRQENACTQPKGFAHQSSFNFANSVRKYGRSHSRLTPSLLPDASTRSSDEKAGAVTLTVWPRQAARSCQVTASSQQATHVVLAANC